VRDSQGALSHVEDLTLGFYAPYQDSALPGGLPEWHKYQNLVANVPNPTTHGVRSEQDPLRNPDHNPSGSQGSQLEQQKHIAGEHGGEFNNQSWAAYIDNDLDLLGAAPDRSQAIGPIPGEVSANLPLVDPQPWASVPDPAVPAPVDQVLLEPGPYHSEAAGSGAGEISVELPFPSEKTGTKHLLSPMGSPEASIKRHSPFQNQPGNPARMASMNDSRSLTSPSALSHLSRRLEIPRNDSQGPRSNFAPGYTLGMISGVRSWVRCFTYSKHGMRLLTLILDDKKLSNRPR
jgi:hypothetical protein